MNGAPPVNQIKFTSDNKQLLIHNAYGISATFGFLLNFIWLMAGIALHKFSILALILTLLFGLLFWACLVRITRSWNQLIIVTPSYIKVENGKGERLAQESFSSVTALKMTWHRDDVKPSLYTIEIGNNRGVMFGREVNQLPELIALIEERTGRKFENTVR